MTNEILDLLLAFLVGVALIIFGYYKRNERRKIMETGIKVEGIAFGIDEEFINQSWSYYPVVRYSTLEKEWVTERYNIASSLSSYYKQGDKVSVIYDSNDSKKFIIDDTGTKVLGPALMAVGCVIIIFTIVQYFFHPFNLQ
jgi:hypothetical protein